MICMKHCFGDHSDMKFYWPQSYPNSYCAPYCNKNRMFCVLWINFFNMFYFCKWLSGYFSAVCIISAYLLA